MAPRRLSSRRVYDGFLAIDEVSLVSADGEEFTREVFRHPGSVTVVPWDGHRVHLVEQYRAAVGRTLLELPAGIVDGDEDPIAAARRELIEETGFQAQRFTVVHRVHASPGYTTELSYIVVAEELTPGERQPSGPEEREASMVSLTLDEVRQGLSEIEDATTLIGLYAILSW